jgi:hypothetical protein
MLSKNSFETVVPSLIGPDKVSDPDNTEIEYDRFSITNAQLIVAQYLVRPRTHWQPQEDMDP